MRRFYLLTRDLHLYVGLFVSPFVLVFALSVFYLVHGLVQRPAPAVSPGVRVVSNVELPPDLAQLTGRPRVEALRPVLDQLGVKGEIDFVLLAPNEHRVIVPVRQPGHDTIVTLNYEQRTAAVAAAGQSLAEAVAYLHKMPGPHNVAVRGNTPAMRGWRVLADATAYSILFLTVSGIYMWAVLRAERRIGLALMLAGAVSFFGLVYAIAT